jgi:hypothetical protein
MIVIFFNLQNSGTVICIYSVQIPQKYYTDAGKELPKPCKTYDFYCATNACTAWQHKISVKLAVTAVLVTGRETTNQIVR